jgi:hypothetical protein
LQLDPADPVGNRRRAAGIGANVVSGDDIAARQWSDHIDAGEVAGDDISLRRRGSAQRAVRDIYHNDSLRAQARGRAGGVCADKVSLDLHI